MSNEPDVCIKWIMSKRPIASKQLGIMAVICSSITAKGPMQTNNPFQRPFMLWVYAFLEHLLTIAL